MTPGLGEQVHGALGQRQRRRQPPGKLLSRPFSDRRLHILDESALLVLGHVVGVAGVVDAVGEELPAALPAGGGDVGEMIADGDVERDAAAHAVAVHGGHHAPDARAIAVVAPGIVQHVGHRTRPWRPRRIERRVELIVLDVGRAPERKTRTLGPCDLGPVVVGQVVVKPRIFSAHVLVPVRQS